MTDITFNFTPDVGYQPDIVPAVNRVKFGGGYTQTSARGINLDGATLRMSFTNRTKAEVDNIVWAIKQSLGGRIIYTLPGETTARLWDVQRWTPPVCGEGGQVWSMELELSETFEDGHANWNPLHLDMGDLDGWTWVNQGGITTVSDATGTTFTVPNSTDGDGSFRYIMRGMPKSGSWEITSHLDFLTAIGAGYGYILAFVGVMNSRTGAIIGVGAGTSFYGGKCRYVRLTPAIDYADGFSFTPDLTIQVNQQDSTVSVYADTIPEGAVNPKSYPWSGIGGRPDSVVIGLVMDTTRTGDVTFRVPSLMVDPL